MPKNIHTPRDELICGKLDKMIELARQYNSCDMAELIHLIRHDAERMEAKLVSRRDEALTRADLSPPVPDDVAEAVERAKLLITVKESFLGANGSSGLGEVMQIAEDRKDISMFKTLIRAVSQTVQEVTVVEDLIEQFRQHVKAIPVGAENIGHGASEYNWGIHYLDVLKGIKIKAGGGVMTTLFPFTCRNGHHWHARSNDTYCRQCGWTPVHPKDTPAYTVGKIEYAPDYKSASSKTCETWYSSSGTACPIGPPTSGSTKPTLQSMINEITPENLHHEQACVSSGGADQAVREGITDPLDALNQNEIKSLRQTVGEYQTRLALCGEAVTQAVTENNALRQRVKELEWALASEIKLGEMHLAIIESRAKQDWLDKKPIVVSILDRRIRLLKALNKSRGGEKI